MWIEITECRRDQQNVLASVGTEVKKEKAAAEALRDGS